LKIGLWATNEKKKNKSVTYFDNMRKYGGEKGEIKKGHSG